MVKNLKRQEKNNSELRIGKHTQAYAQLPSLRVYECRREEDKPVTVRRCMQLVTALTNTQFNEPSFWIFSINPGSRGVQFTNPNDAKQTIVPLVFPALNNLFELYEEWQAVDIVFHYIPRVGTFEAGTLRFGASPDPTVLNPNTMEALATYTHTVSTQIADNVNMRLHCGNKWYFMRTNSTRGSTVNPRLTDPWKFVVGAERGNNAIGTFGDIYVSYEIRCRNYINPDANDDIFNRTMSIVADTTTATVPSDSFGGALPLGTNPEDDPLQNGLRLRSQGGVLNTLGVEVPETGMYCVSYKAVIENAPASPFNAFPVVDGNPRPNEFQGTLANNIPGSEFSFSCVLDLAAGAVLQIGSNLAGWALSNPQLLIEAIF